LYGNVLYGEKGANANNMYKEVKSNKIPPTQFNPLYKHETTISITVCFAYNGPPSPDVAKTSTLFATSIDLNQWGCVHQTQSFWFLGQELQ